jgi:exodeoxyribonuclease V gamma subunit
MLSEVAPTVESLMSMVDALPFAKAEAESAEVNLPLPDGRSLVGTVSGVREGTILRCIYSKLGPKHRLAAWARFLALSAARPDLGVSAVTVGRGEGRRRGAPRVSVAELGVLDPDPDGRRSTAMAALHTLVDLYDRGMREPLPIYCATSAAWARARRSLEDPGQPARSKWETPFESPPHEDRDRDHILVLGTDFDFGELVARLPESDEAGDGWAETETSRLGRFAMRLWDPVLDHERLEEH